MSNVEMNSGIYMIPKSSDPALKTSRTVYTIPLKTGLLAVGEAGIFYRDADLKWNKLSDDSDIAVILRKVYGFD